MDANLLDAIRKVGAKNSLDDILLFGRVRCAIKRPNILGNVETAAGMFAIIDVYAVKCLGKDYFSEGGNYDVNRVYFTKGSMIIYIDSNKWIGKDVKVFGSSFRKGVKIKQQFGKKSMYDGITALTFSYANGKFVIIPNKLAELGEKDAETRGTLLEDFIVSIVKNKSGVIEYPVTLDSIQVYEGVIDYEELSSDSAAEESKIFDTSNERIDISKIKLNLVHHLEGSDVSELYEDFGENIKEMASYRKDYAKELVDLVDSLFEAEMEDDCDYDSWGDATATPLDDILVDIRSTYISKIASQYSNVIGKSNVRGKNFVDGLIEKCGNPLWYENDIEMPDNINEMLESLRNMVRLDSSVLFGNTGSIIDALPVLNSVIMFDIYVIAITTGISSDVLYGSYRMCSRDWYMTIDSWFLCLLRFPYALGMLSNLSVHDCDVLYYSYHKKYGKGILKEENHDMRLNLMFLETLDSANSTDTLISKYALRNKEFAYPEIQKKNIIKNGFPAKDSVVDALTLMCGDILLSKNEIVKLTKDKWYTVEREENLTKYGLVNSLDDTYLILESDVEKEYFIYSTLIFKGETPTGITEEQIKTTIDNFEADRGFKLESLQRDGIHLCMSKAGVLSGCAGSGKTTTSDCMTEVLKNLEGYKIIYVTPTGKACRRLAEVVKGTVRTIHSQFGVGLYGSSYLSEIKSTYRFAEPKIYLCDEMAMCPTKLLFEICKNLGNNDIIYFLGDIRQLPPIGKGTPFKLLMHLLPCIELGVSKRAAEGSLVNYNTTLLNHMSDGVVKELLYDDSTFVYRECADAVIALEVVNMWRDFMNGVYGGIKYAEEDIQVITGYQSDKYVFSTTKLNPPLQSFLRKNDRLLFKHGERSFYENDRVIHTKLNCYDMRRYVYSGGVFQSVATFGMVNGEMGKLVGILRTDSVSIRNDWSLSDPIYDGLSDEEKENIKKQYEEREDTLRDDSKLHDDKHYFVVVQVHDSTIGKDVYAFYQARAYVTEEGISLSGEDVGLLELAYALTTHKMQGSQSPVVILPFGSNCSPYFINRNMINTMITRSTGIVGMVGTIKGSNSPINQGRLHVSAEKSKDILTLLVEGSY